ncbi:hypothetical protein T484DRAFT_2202560 [Baffinella frigidus]|nr:hypothetical protein T484DRAFT_2202560 [Cryptophyta sp. CCMP2293]
MQLQKLVWSTRKQDSKLIDVCTANSVGFTQIKKCINEYKMHPAVSPRPDARPYSSFGSKLAIRALATRAQLRVPTRALHSTVRSGLWQGGAGHFGPASQLFGQPWRGRGRRAAKNLQLHSAARLGCSSVPRVPALLVPGWVLRWEGSAASPRFPGVVQHQSRGRAAYGAGFFIYRGASAPPGSGAEVLDVRGAQARLAYLREYANGNPYK